MNAHTIDGSQLVPSLFPTKKSHGIMEEEMSNTSTVVVPTQQQQMETERPQAAAAAAAEPQQPRVQTAAPFPPGRQRWQLEDGWMAVPKKYLPPNYAPGIMFWNEGKFFSITPMSESDIPVKVIQNTLTGDVELLQNMYRAGDELVQVSKIAYLPMDTSKPIVRWNVAYLLVRGAVVPGIKFVEGGIKIDEDKQKRKRDAETVVATDLYVSQIQRDEMQKALQPMMEYFEKSNVGWQSVARTPKPEDVKMVDYFYWDQASPFLTKNVTSGDDIPIMVWYHPTFGVWPQQPLFKIKATGQCFILDAVKAESAKVGPKEQDVVVKIHMRLSMSPENFRDLFTRRNKTIIREDRMADLDRLISSAKPSSLEE